MISTNNLKTERLCAPRGIIPPDPEFIWAQRYRRGRKLPPSVLRRDKGSVGRHSSLYELRRRRLTDGNAVMQ